MEATRLLAHALPRREAVWWACMCAAHTEPPDLPEADRKAREAAEHWVRQPSDQDRIGAMQQADATAVATPESWVAMAAFWCGDSITPEGQPAMPPKPHIAGKDVERRAGAGRGALRAEAAGGAAQRFLESGRNIAAGGAGRLRRRRHEEKERGEREAKGRQGKENTPPPLEEGGRGGGGTSIRVSSLIRTPPPATPGEGVCSSSSSPPPLLPHVPRRLRPAMTAAAAR